MKARINKEMKKDTSMGIVPGLLPGFNYPLIIKNVIMNAVEFIGSIVIPTAREKSSQNIFMYKNVSPEGIEEFLMFVKVDDDYNMRMFEYRKKPCKIKCNEYKMTIKNRNFYIYPVITDKKFNRMMYSIEMMAEADTSGLLNYMDNLPLLGEAAHIESIDHIIKNDCCKRGNENNSYYLTDKRKNILIDLISTKLKKEYPEFVVDNILSTNKEAILNLYVNAQKACREKARDMIAMKHYQEAIAKYKNNSDALAKSLAKATACMKENTAIINELEGRMENLNSKYNSYDIASINDYLHKIADEFSESKKNELMEQMLQLDPNFLDQFKKAEPVEKEVKVTTTKTIHNNFNVVINNINGDVDVAIGNWYTFIKHIKDLQLKRTLPNDKIIGCFIESIKGMTLAEIGERMICSEATAANYLEMFNKLGYDTGYVKRNQKKPRSKESYDKMIETKKKAIELRTKKFEELLLSKNTDTSKS